MRRAIGLLIFFAVVSCARGGTSGNPIQPAPGQGNGPQLVQGAGSLSGYSYTIIRDGGLAASDSVLSGVGVVRFDSLLADSKQPQRFRISVLVEQGGEVSLAVFGDDALDRSVTVGFIRREDKVFIVTSNSAAIENESSSPFELQGVDGSQAVDVVIEVDNSKEAPRLFVKSIATGSELWNSQVAAQNLSKGEGLRWGASLRNAELRLIAVDPVGQSPDNEDPAVPTQYSVADLMETSRKAAARFTRLAIPDSKIKSIKTWKSATYVWAKLVYRVEKEGANSAEGYLYLACHFHGTLLGCHKRDESDGSEPETANRILRSP
jgi:hypothetical protein